MGTTAAAAGLFVSLLVVAAFVVGRAATLSAAAAAGGRWLTPDEARKARRVDVAIAVVLLLSAASYAWRLFDGQVLTVLPGEGGLLP